MNIFSLEFIILIVVLLILYYVIPKRYQWMLLLLGSIVFYAFSGIWNLIFVGVTSLTTYLAGRSFKRFSKESKKQKKALLVGTLLINFGILAVLKYIPSFTHVGWLLPLGISFYTFQAVGYLLDQYYGKYEPEENYFKYLLFISFFPQLIQGPINRYNQLSKDLLAEHRFDWERTKRAVAVILFGLMKKFAIANMLSQPIALILDSPTNDTPGSLIVFGILMYSAQQYADFSGGIDIVLGIAELFGISMMPNFRQPYFAVSLADFWRRWHISLGAWMKDYLFYPFAISKKMQKLGKWGTKRLGRTYGRLLPACLGNLLVFIVVGIWHGAESHYILWGLYNGIVIVLADVLGNFFTEWKNKWKVDDTTKGFHIFRIIRTFIIVNIGWYFDRIIKWSDCALCFKNTVCQFEIGRLIEETKNIFGQVEIINGKTVTLLVIALVIVFINSLVKERGKDLYTFLMNRNIVIRWGMYYGLMLLVQLSMSLGNVTEQFLYAVF